MTSWSQDLRYALRQLRKSPGSSVVQTGPVDPVSTAGVTRSVLCTRQRSLTMRSKPWYGRGFGAGTSLSITYNRDGQPGETRI
jgi:hypothetical protein